MRRKGHCGVVVIQTILNCRAGFLGGNPLELYSRKSFWERTLASTGSILLETMIGILREKKFKVNVEDKKDSTDAEKISFLRSCVDYNERVVLLIMKESGRWYIPNWVLPHYITIEGYCGDSFLIFDPSVRVPKRGCGNSEITSMELMKQWRPNPLFKFLRIKSMAGAIALVVSND